MIGPFGMRPRGTMSVRALPMAQALAARGHRVTLLLPPWQNPEDAGQRWEEGGVAIENVTLPPRLPILFHLLLARRLARRALALRPDVVHLFKPKAYSGLAHRLLALRPGARRPRLVVDGDDWEGPGGWNEIGGYTPAQRSFFARQERWGLTHAGAITVASHALESLAWAMGVPPERVFYVPNGVPASSRRQPPAESRPPAPAIRQPVVLLYTRFFEFPVSRVVSLLCRVRQELPEARLLVVGKGLSGEEEELFRLAAQSGLAVDAGPLPRPPSFPSSAFHADVIYCGWVPTETLYAYFARAHVAVYPFDDTLVNRCKCAAKLCDLLAAGVPVVVEAVGQNREYVRHGDTGWLVEPGDVDAFARAVVRLLRDDPLREQLGRAAARDLRERFAWKHLVESVERAYGAI
jgi:glycosyltransferase involved in cell wall biosynthesis